MAKSPVAAGAASDPLLLGILALDVQFNYVGTHNSACVLPPFWSPHSGAHSAGRSASERGGIGSGRTGIDWGLAL
jgi:hypothetical protein